LKPCLAPRRLYRHFDDYTGDRRGHHDPAFYIRHKINTLPAFIYENKKFSQLLPNIPRSRVAHLPGTAGEQGI
jgi:hypothetical protein